MEDNKTAQEVANEEFMKKVKTIPGLSVATGVRTINDDDLPPGADAGPYEEPKPKNPNDPDDLPPGAEI